MQNNPIILEACIESIEEANYYAGKKIDRFELCSRLDLSGLNPSNELVNHCLNHLKISSVIMLRLRNDFSFQSTDLIYYEKLIKEYKSLGATQFIFGFIKAGQIDVEACKLMLELLVGCQCGFHMAIDDLGNYESNLQKLKGLGFQWVLTKGGKQPAMENIATLKSLVHQFDTSLKILVGGKVTSENWKDLHEKTGATWFHGRKIK